jgi:hypothetical protein
MYGDVSEAKNYDAEAKYYIYTISMSDMSSSTRYGVASTFNEAKLTAFTKTIEKLDHSKPLFIASHQPLHDNRNDNQHAGKWYDVISTAADKMDIALKAVKIQKEICPNKEPFINYNPYYDGNEASLGGVNFEDWAHDFTTKSGIKQFSYDAYDQLNPDDATHTGINFYYKNLLKYTTVAKRENLPLWVTNLAVGHFRYRCPTEDDFRWQLNTTVASGANGAWWYFLYLRLPRLNYRLAPIDEYGNRTESYERLARIQNIFQHQFGTLFTNLIHDETYHTGLSFGGYSLLPYNTHKYLKEVVAKNEVPGLVSFFHTKENEIYMAFVNNSQTESDVFTFKFTKNVKEIYRVVYGLPPEKTVLTEKDEKYPVFQTKNGSYETNCLKNDNANNCFEDNGKLYNSAWLAPGQMEVYRIVTE